ncbi:hypothetical protein [Mesorhizobium sp. B2-3-10]|uniref:hypothetical protein n=1 Tax=Mesorhizobium sp. B2-3-10 TaxID=2589954 RepID=UPI00112BA385|nr:hypothetical protein [Mesorhizobium sp. B2-3-10]TPL98322.1 hypothetical protein FJ943_15570 [Mesorhizobium sp. B2-3-10]
MRSKLILLASAAALIAASVHAANWERPSGGYTPTNHSVNTTKYQTDRANGVAISSVKVDGDLNKAFQGLNDIDARTAPSVVGQSGKFLTNNGANSVWGLVSTSAIDSGPAPAGYVLVADGVSGTSFGLLDASSFPVNVTSGTYVLPTLTLNSAGIVTAVTRTDTVSVTNVGISNSLFVSGTATVSGSVTVNGALSVNGKATNRAFAKAWVSFNGVGGATILSSHNIGSVVKNSTGQYTVTLSPTMADINYAVIITSENASGAWSGLGSRSSSAFDVKVQGTGGFADSGYVSAVVYAY